MMDVNAIPRAWQNLQEQGMKNDGYVASLDALWRASGCPAGQSPEEWIQLAARLLEGLSDYRAKVATLFPDSDEWDFIGGDPVLTWKVTIEELRDEAESCRRMGLDWEYDDFRRDGDTMAVAEVAQYYARFLDAKDVSIGDIED